MIDRLPDETTRDLAVRTATRLEDMDHSSRDFMRESREFHKRCESQFAKYDAMLNRGRGFWLAASIGFSLLAFVGGVMAAVAHWLLTGKWP